jgi:hypothetical protein
VTQKISSAATSVKQVPAILNKILQVMDHPGSFLAYTSDVLDMGGGKYDLLTARFREMGIRNWVYDPFNRSPEHNAFVVEMLTTKRADNAVCSNVLNVIKDPFDRKVMHRLLQSMTKEDGLVFFTVYEGDGSSVGRKTSKGWQANKPTKSYLRELRKYYGSVTLCSNKLIVCQGVRQ